MSRIALLATIIASTMAFLPRAEAGSEAAPSALGDADLALLERATWGANKSAAREFTALGRERWLDAQLHPQRNDRLRPAAQAMINAMPIATIPISDIAIPLAVQQRAANQVHDPDQKKAAQEAYQKAMRDLATQAMTRSLLRNLYSADQLREKMTWFWFNHFNVNQGKADIRALIGDYEERAIRQHALGKFRDLLAATLRHPAMLRYLDNAENARGHLNENYAREIMELHTLGVVSGYTQEDVTELARILTGVGLSLAPGAPQLPLGAQQDYVRDGLFEFNPTRHEYSFKHLLGHTIEGHGFAEAEQALDILSRHPATARHISQEIATYFVADAPPEQLVLRMAQTFQKTDGDIASVLAVMFRSAEFNASSKAKYKDPMQFVLSALRLAYDAKVIANAAPIQGWLSRLAEGLFNHDTPDGYPMISAAWSGPGQMAVRFEIARQIGSSPSGLFKPPVADAVDTPAFPLITNAFYFGTLQHTLGAATRAALDQAISPQDWNTLFLSSPEFMR